ncbi:hypothetical protein TNCV_106081 [Trichonephila clavipes]|nr:hypothetical protein TNCV_106081 [Trichonephila clavipes]
MKAIVDRPRNFEPLLKASTTPQLAPPFLTSTPHQREDVLASTYLTCIGLLCTVAFQQHKARTCHESVTFTIRLLWPPLFLKSVSLELLKLKTPFGGVRTSVTEEKYLRSSEL